MTFPVARNPLSVGRPDLDRPLLAFIAAEHAAHAQYHPPQTD